MPDCSYCGDSFDSEDAYLAHLESRHEGELGPIDRRRIGDGEGEEGIGLRGILLAALVVIPVVVAAYVLFFTGGAPANALEEPETMPTGVGTTHEHGTINVTINGTELDFSQPEFQKPGEFDAFHFEAGTDEWHVHARRVTLQYAMWTLDIGVTEDAVRYDGETYTSENATVIVEVNGEPVDPAEHVLSGASNAENGEHVRIVVRTE
jgi:hypothetical protein